MDYLIEHFLKPWGYVLNGNCNWQGEETTDCGTISIENNVVNVVAKRSVTGYWLKATENMNSRR